MTNHSDNVPDDLFYSPEHQWLRIEGDSARVGITAYAQDELGEIIDVSLPKPGTAFDFGQKFGEVESMKVASEVYAPAAGEVTEAHEVLRETPELINKDPYGEGWLIALHLTTPVDTSKLLTPAAYRELIRKEQGG